MITLVDWFKTIRQESGRNRKKELLDLAAQEYPIVPEMLNRAYSKEWVYGIKKLAQVPTGSSYHLEELWGMVLLHLDDLHNRIITGNLAREATDRLLARFDLDDQELLIGILKGDLDCGVNVATINEVFPECIPETPYMRCSVSSKVDMDKWGWDGGVYGQEKMDGMFANVMVMNDGLVTIKTRAGTRLPLDPLKNLHWSLADSLIAGHVYMGEMLVFKSGELLPRETGNGILNSILKGGTLPENHRVKFMMWDVVPLDDFLKGKCVIPYADRLAMLHEIRSVDSWVGIVETQRYQSKAEAQKHYAEIIAAGGEGTVVKRGGGIWKDGTSKECVKLKVEAEVDLKVVGFNEGEGKNAATFGSLICQSSDGKLEVSVSGFTDSDRQRIFKEMDEWVSSGRIITVRANMLMPPTNKDQWSLFLPRFVEERLDKTEADDLIKIQEIFK